MKPYPIFIMMLLCAVVVFTIGCTSQTTMAPASTTPAPVPVTTSLPPSTPPPTAIQTSAPTPVPVKRDKITDGYWCRDTTRNIGKAPTNVRECYKFNTDGTFTWGYSPGYPMGKSPSCWAPDVPCTYTLTANGRYEVSGGYFYTLSGDLLIDPHDQPAFGRSSAGIP